MCAAPFVMLWHFLYVLLNFYLAFDGLFLSFELLFYALFVVSSLRRLNNLHATSFHSCVSSAINVCVCVSFCAHFITYSIGNECMLLKFAFTQRQHREDLPFIALLLTILSNLAATAAAACQSIRFIRRMRVPYRNSE